MFRNRSKVASSRRVKVPSGPETTAGATTQALQQHTAGATDQDRKRARQDHASAHPAVAAMRQHPSSRASKAHALAVFQGLVDKASNTRHGSTVPEPTTSAAPVVCPSARQEPNGLHVVDSSAVQPAQDSLPAVVPAVPAQSPAAQTTSPCEPSLPTLVQKAVHCLQELQLQLQSCTKTYLYQFDAVLQQAKQAVVAVADHLTTKAVTHADRGAGVKLQHPLLQQGGQQQHDCIDTVVKLSCSIWSIIKLLLKHHHTAEPDNTASQAKEFHHAARVVWEAGAAAADTVDAAADDPSPGSDIPSDALLQDLNTLAQVASSWADIGKTDCTIESDWCYLQLRKHLCRLKRVEEDGRQQLALRRDLQKLLLAILQGNILMVARQGQQILWCNLTNMLQHLLSASVLDPEDNISTCLTLAGALAQSQCVHESNHSGSNDSNLKDKSTAADAAAAYSTAVSCRILEFAADLLGYCRKQAEGMRCQQDQQQKQQQQERMHASAGGVKNGSAGSQIQVVLQHISDVQQQVLLQLCRAYLHLKEYNKTLDCVNSIRGLLGGRPPPQGLVQLSSLALLGQGKHLTACAQLCAWLKQSCVESNSSKSDSRGNCSLSSAAAEACAAVDAFLWALYSKASCSTAEVGHLVEMIAEAASEYCKGDAGVAVAVVKQMLTRLASSEQGDHLGQLVLKLLATEAVAQHILKTSQDRQAIHALLHQHGQLQYEARNFTSAVQFLTPAVFFSTTITVGKSARLLAACLLKANEPQRALEYVSLAEQQEGQTTTVGCLIRLQAALPKAAAAAAAVVVNNKGNGRAAAAGGSSLMVNAEVFAALEALSGCAEFDKQSLQVAFSMCMQARNHKAAWELLKLCCKLPSFSSTATPAAAATGPGPGPGPSPAPATETPRPLSVLNQDQQALMSSMTATAAADKFNCNHRCMHILVLMHMIFQEVQRQTCMSNNSQLMLLDICLVYSACTAHAAAAAVDSVVAAAAAVSTSTAHCTYSQQQLMWLADTGLQLGLLAAEHMLHDSSLTFINGASNCCSALQQLLQQHNTAEVQIDTAAVDEQSQQHDGRSSAVLVPLYMRHVSAVTASVSLLLQSPDTAAAAAAAAQLMKQAQQLLHMGQSNLLLLQRLQATDTTAATPCSLETLHRLQHLISKLNFTVASRLQDEQLMKQSLQYMVQSPLAKPSHFKAAAQYCLMQNSGHRSEAVAALAYGYMLRLATSLTAAAAAAAAAAVQASADLAAAADAVIGIMNLVPSHSVKIKALKKLTAALAEQSRTAAAAGSSVRAEVFPPDSLQWLIATCWNTAVQLGAVQHNAAVALQYLDSVAALAAYQHTVRSGKAPAATAIAAAAPDKGYDNDGCHSTCAEKAQRLHWLLDTSKYISLKATLESIVITSTSSNKCQLETITAAAPPPPPPPAAAPAATEDGSPAGNPGTADQDINMQQQQQPEHLISGVDVVSRTQEQVVGMEKHTQVCDTERDAGGQQQVHQLAYEVQCIRSSGSASIGGVAVLPTLQQPPQQLAASDTLSPKRSSQQIMAGAAATTTVAADLMASTPPAGTPADANDVQQGMAAAAALITTQQQLKESSQELTLQLEINSSPGYITDIGSLPHADVAQVAAAVAAAAAATQEAVECTEQQAVAPGLSSSQGAAGSQQQTFRPSLATPSGIKHTKHSLRVPRLPEVADNYQQPTARNKEHSLIAVGSPLQRVDCGAAAGAERSPDTPSSINADPHLCSSDGAKLGQEDVHQGVAACSSHTGGPAANSFCLADSQLIQSNQGQAIVEQGVEQPAYPSQDQRMEIDDHDYDDGNSQALQLLLSPIGIASNGEV